MPNCNHMFARCLFLHPA